MHCFIHFIHIIHSTISRYFRIWESRRENLVYSKIAEIVTKEL